MGIFDIFKPGRIDYLAGAAQLPPLQPTGTDLATWEDTLPLEQVTMARLYPDSDYVHVDRSAAMSIAAVAKIRHIYTGAIAKMPLVHMNGNARAANQSPLCKQPEAGRPRSQTVTWAIDAMIFYGRAWFEITARYAEDNRPRQTRWIPEWSGTADAAGNFTLTDGRKILARDLIRVDGPHEGLLNFGQARIREALAIDTAAANASANPVPSIELHQTGGDPLTTTQIGDLVSAWTRARKKGGVAFTNQSVEMKPHGQAAEQLLIDGRNVVALNLARSLGAPAWLVDAVVSGSSLTYSNSPSRARELIDFGLSSYMTAFADRFSMDDVLAAGQWCRFDPVDLTRPEFKDRMEGYKIAIETNVYTLAECQAMEAGIPLEDVTK